MTCCVSAEARGSALGSEESAKGTTSPRAVTTQHMEAASTEPWAPSQLTRLTAMAGRRPGTGCTSLSKASGRRAIVKTGKEQAAAALLDPGFSEDRRKKWSEKAPVAFLR